MNQKRLCAWGRGAEQGLVYETANSVSLMLCEITARMTVDLRVVVGNEMCTKLLVDLQSQRPGVFANGHKRGCLCEVDHAIWCVCGHWWIYGTTGASVNLPNAWS